MTKRVCKLPECGRPHRGLGFCELHYRRYRLTGKVSTTRRENGTGCVKNGYIWIDGRYQHRTVMEEVLGRPLLPSENVHHKNGDRQDNRPENLELWVTLQPAGQRIEDLLAYADEIIARYRHEPSSCGRS